MKKDIATIPGTVASVMRRSLKTIDFYHSLDKAKSDVIALLESAEIKDRAYANKCIHVVSQVTNMHHLMSIVTTYCNGMKVGI